MLSMDKTLDLLPQMKMVALIEYFWQLTNYFKMFFVCSKQKSHLCFAVCDMINISVSFTSRLTMFWLGLTAQCIYFILNGPNNEERKQSTYQLAKKKILFVHPCLCMYG